MRRSLLGQGNCVQRFLFVFVILAAGCAGPASSERKALEPSVIKLLGDSAGIISGAESAEAFLLVGEKGPSARSLHGYPVIETRMLSAEQKDRMSALLVSPDGFTGMPPKLCDFHPFIALRFKKGQEETDVLLCFSCDERRVFHKDRMISEHIDFIRKDLVQLTKALFGSHPAVQRLRESVK